MSIAINGSGRWQCIVIVHFCIWQVLSICTDFLLPPSNVIFSTLLYQPNDTSIITTMLIVIIHIGDAIVVFLWEVLHICWAFGLSKEQLNAETGFRYVWEQGSVGGNGCSLRGRYGLGLGHHTMVGVACIVQVVWRSNCCSASGFYRSKGGQRSTMSDYKLREDKIVQ